MTDNLILKIELAKHRVFMDKERDIKCAICKLKLELNAPVLEILISNNLAWEVHYHCGILVVGLINTELAKVRFPAPLTIPLPEK